MRKLYQTIEIDDTDKKETTWYIGFNLTEATNRYKQARFYNLYAYDEKLVKIELRQYIIDSSIQRFSKEAQKRCWKEAQERGYRVLKKDLI